MNLTLGNVNNIININVNLFYIMLAKYLVNHLPSARECREDFKKVYRKVVRFLKVASSLITLLFTLQGESGWRKERDGIRYRSLEISKIFLNSPTLIKKNYKNFRTHLIGFKSLREYIKK